MNDVQQFERLSKQRVHYTPLPGGGMRARITITLPNGKPYSFVEDVTASDVQTYESQIAGAEIGYAIGEIVSVNGAFTGSVVEVGFLGSIVKTIGKGIKAVGKLAKKVVTSKVMQTAAKGLAIVAPALGPLAPTALAVAGGIGIAGKLLSAKNAESVGATRTAAAVTHEAIADAKRLTKSPAGMKGLLAIGLKKSNSAMKLASSASKVLPALAAGGGGVKKLDVLALARAGRIQSNQGGIVTPAMLESARGSGRLFFLQAG